MITSSQGGALGFDADLLAREEIRAADLSCFVIEGCHDGAPVGRWALAMLNEETSWALTFLPRSSEFAVFGPGRLMPQAWNMDGAGTDCGPGGFGFLVLTLFDLDLLVFSLLFVVFGFGL